MTAAFCLACGGGTMLNRGMTGEGTLQSCSRCGTLRLCGVAEAAVASATPSLNGAPYALSGIEYGAAYQEGLRPQKAMQLYALFERAAGEAPGRMLDVGCANGDFLERAYQSGWKGLGLDVDPHAVARVRGRGLDAVCGAADASSTLEGEFDVATMWDLIEHVPRPDFTAAWIAKRVRPGGRVVLLTPDASSVLDRMAAAERALTYGRSTRLMDLCLNRYHLHRFTAPGLRALFGRHGFRCERLEHVRLFSLQAERYLSGFAPGIAGWTPWPRLNRLASRAAFAALVLLRIRNKLLYVGVRELARR